MTFCVLNKNVPSCTSVHNEIDFSSIFLLGGDIVVNPGPVERDKLEEAASRFSKVITDFLTQNFGVRAEFRKITEKFTEMEAEISHIRRKMKELH